MPVTNVLSKWVSGNLVFYSALNGNTVFTMTPYGVNYEMVQGRIYHVDNVNGSDTTGDGLSWSSAFAQVNAAVTAAEAYRLAQANVYTRNKILIAGTGTAYAAVTALPNYCDVIGVGAPPFGNGAGIAIINGSAAAHAVTGNCRGNYFNNLQFTASGAYWSFYGGQILRTVFEDCCFRNDAAASNGGLYCGAVIGAGTGNCGGVVLRRCRFDGDSGYPVYGIYVLANKTFNNCLIENCMIHGTTAGIYIGAGCDDIGTAWRNCVVGDQGGGCTKAIEDNGSGYAAWQDMFCTSASAANTLASKKLFHVVKIDQAAGTATVVATGT